jgi:hypothetical protein
MSWKKAVNSLALRLMPFLQGNVEFGGHLANDI